MIEGSSRIAGITRMKSQRKPAAGPIQDDNFRAAQIAGQYGSTQVQRFDEQDRQPCNPRPDIEAAPTGCKPPEQGFRDAQAEATAGLSFRFPEFISAFIAIHSGKLPVIEALERSSDCATRGTTDSP